MSPVPDLFLEEPNMELWRNIPTNDLLMGQAYIWTGNNHWNGGAAKDNPQRVLRQVLRQSHFFEDVEEAEYGSIEDSAEFHHGTIHFELPDGSGWEIFSQEMADAYIEDYANSVAQDVYLEIDRMGHMSPYIKFDAEMFMRDVHLSGDDEHILDSYGDGLDEVTIFGVDMDTHTGGGIIPYITVYVRRTH
jgi:hypothetical protein